MVVSDVDAEDRLRRVLDVPALLARDRRCASCRDVHKRVHSTMLRQQMENRYKEMKYRQIPQSERGTRTQTGHVIKRSNKIVDNCDCLTETTGSTAECSVTIVNGFGKSNMQTLHRCSH